MLDAIVLQRLHHHFGARHFALPPSFCPLLIGLGPVLSILPSGRCWSFSRVLGNKKGPRGSLCVAHGRISPGGYTALPTRLPTRMSAVFMVADNRGGKASLSTAKMTSTGCAVRGATRGRAMPLARRLIGRRAGYSRPAINPAACNAKRADRISAPFSLRRHGRAMLRDLLRAVMRRRVHRQLLLASEPLLRRMRETRPRQCLSGSSHRGRRACRRHAPWAFHPPPPTDALAASCTVFKSPGNLNPPAKPVFADEALGTTAGSSLRIGGGRRCSLRYGHRLAVDLLDRLALGRIEPGLGDDAPARRNHLRRPDRRHHRRGKLLQPWPGIDGNHLIAKPHARRIVHDDGLVDDRRVADDGDVFPDRPHTTVTRSAAPIAATGARHHQPSS